MHTFDEEPTRPKRAQQLWQILVAKATSRQVATYGELEKIVGYKGAGVFAQILGHIMHYCHENGLPPLTAVIVKKDTGLPGSGLTTESDLDASREKVFRYPWFRLVPPAPEELRDAYRRAHTPPSGRQKGVG